ncbi:4Fe-4S dicluster domain-containing protein [Thermacetogenium phaeum]|uniref:4Fe-4S dicluster domain-containing protein n=1 Tax=Thermacetogenium phaeum TaxID=85874 RepID=UPI0009DB34BB|nr:ferredoxin family protein [Thermacetogenium phaeum]
MNDKVYVTPETPAANPIVFDPELCTGCNRCVDICQVDLFIPNPEKGKPPIALYVGECWYCGCCVMECPKPGAIKLRHPLMNQVHWERRKK